MSIDEYLERLAEEVRKNPNKIHNAAGPCEFGYHRGFPGRSCWCGELKGEKDDL